MMLCLPFRDFKPYTKPDRLNSSSKPYDAVIVGSGPNGLAAAIRLALEGLSVKVFEASETVGGGMRTQELIQPGIHHDICSAIHPMAAASPFLKKLPLEKYGLKWIHPDHPAAHPLDDEPPAILWHDLQETASELDEDADIYKSLVSSLVDNWNGLTEDFLGPLGLPKHPVQMASFGLKGLRSAHSLQKKFKTKRAKALFAGLAAHSILPLDILSTSAIGLVLAAAAHTAGWPLPKGGSQSIALAMAHYLNSLGGEIETGVPVNSLDQLPESKVVLFDLTPRQVIEITGDLFPASYKKRLEKYKYGAGVFKMDFILKEPVPWKDPECAKAGTVHIGGSFEEIARSEKETGNGGHPEKPFVLAAQQSLFDQSRTPDNRHTLWAYCHVPNSSTTDMTTPIENQIERFAPGFRDVIDQKITMNTEQFNSYNANYIGGDINGGRQDIWQLFSRPLHFVNPYATPSDGIYFCSASTPPGGGVHGMCGYHAASLALKRNFGRSKSEWVFKI